MFTRIFQFLYPHHCAICGILTHDKIICETCFSNATRQYSYCEQCGADMAHNHCVRCELVNDQSNIDRYIIGYQYSDVMRDAIIKLKFNRQMYMARVIQELMLPVIQEYEDIFRDVDYILPMPIDRIRLAGRGFNHMYEIAISLQKYIHKPILYNKLHKASFSIPQSQLSKQERANNLKSSFNCDEISGHILLLDDVLTTGATLKYASSSLVQAGAEKITALILSKV